METLMPPAEVPAPAFELCYNGQAITADIAPFTLALTYTDHLSGASDELDVELEDSDGRWLDAWYPEKGATLALKLGYQGAALAPVGRFDIDEVCYQSPPAVLSIRALATGAQQAVRTRQGRGYERTTLAAIAQRIAKRHQMALSGNIAAIAIERATQYHETDLAFLARLAGEYGHAFKVIDNNRKLVFWQQAQLYRTPAVRRYAPADLIHWRARDQLIDAPGAVTAKYHDAARKTLLCATVGSGQTALSPGPGRSADTAKITRRVASKQAAEAQARAELERRQLEQTRLDATVGGDPALAAGSVIELAGLGRLSGRYTITRATHRISRGEGYQTALELKRVAAGPSTPPAGNAKP